MGLNGLSKILCIHTLTYRYLTTQVFYTLTMLSGDKYVIIVGYGTIKYIFSHFNDGPLTFRYHDSNIGGFIKDMVTP